jgi:hypothetical protein
MTNQRPLEKPNTYASIAVFTVLIFLVSVFCYVSYHKGLDDCRSSCRALKSDAQKDRYKARAMLIRATEIKAQIDYAYSICQRCHLDF